jgi:type II secretory pathway component PulK
MKSEVRMTNDESNLNARMTNERKGGGFSHSVIRHSSIDSSFVIRHSNFRGRRRGSAFVMTVWILAAMTGLVLAVGHGVRVEADAAANRLATAQAAAAEKGAEQFVLSAVAAEIATPGTLNTDDVQNTMSGMQVADAYFYILKPDPEDETALAFGLTDEAGKLDINTATEQQLINLPNMTQDIVDSIIDWRDADSTPGGEGAEDPYYQSLPTPYQCKNANFETVEELMLVKGIDADVLFGTDTARAGRANSAPNASANPNPAAPNAPAPSPDMNLLGTNLGTNVSNRGIFPFITIYGVKAGTAPTTSLNSNAFAGVTNTATTIADVNAADQTQLRNNLQRYISGANVENLLSLTRQNRPFANIWDWAVRTNITTADFGKIMNYIRATPAPSVAKVNVNTAPKEVLMCLPSLTETDAQAILAHRDADPTPADPSDISWMLDTIPKAKLAAVGNYLTGISYCYSADILAASADGRAFKRFRIVVDASSGTPKIIYRRDMTSFGWPLPPEYRDSLKNHQGPNPDSPLTGALPS